MKKHYKVIQSCFFAFFLLLTISSVAQTMIIKNGFEGTTSATAKPSSPIQHGLLRGNDGIASSDWYNDLEQNQYFGFGQITYEQGDSTQRKTEIVTDPLNANNKALRFRIKDEHIIMSDGSTKCRTQYELFNNEPAPAGGYMKEYYQKCRLYFSPDFKILEDASTFTGWIVMQEYWDKLGYNGAGTNDNQATRIGVGISRNRDAAGEKLRFNVGFRDPVMAYPSTWEVTNTTFAIPFGKWMTEEIYIKEGDEQTGRVYMAITVDGVKTVICDKVGRTTRNPAAGYYRDGQTMWTPMKIYTQGSVGAYFKSHGKNMDVLWDDVEIWVNKRPDGIIMQEVFVKQDALGIDDNTGGYDFGKVNPGDSKIITFTIQNSKSTPLNLTGTPRVIVTGSAFSLVTDAATPISAGGTTTFQVKFNPTTDGQFSGAVSIANDDGIVNPYNFSIIGKSGTINNLIGNSTFDVGLTEWEGGWKEASTTSTNEIVTKEGYSGNVCKVNITNGGTTDWYLQLAHLLPLVSGRTYSIKFKASADAPRTIGWEFQQNVNPKTIFTIQNAIALTTTPTTYGPYTYTSTVTESNQSLKFLLGGSNIPVYFDDIEVTEQYQTGINDLGADNPKIKAYSVTGGLNIETEKAEKYQIVNIFGQVVKTGVTYGGVLFVPFHKQGICIVQINQNAIKVFVNN